MPKLFNLQILEPSCFKTSIGRRIVDVRWLASLFWVPLMKVAMPQSRCLSHCTLNTHRRLFFELVYLAERLIKIENAVLSKVTMSRPSYLYNCRNTHPRRLITMATVVTGSSTKRVSCSTRGTTSQAFIGLDRSRRSSATLVPDDFSATQFLNNAEHKPFQCGAVQETNLP